MEDQRPDFILAYDKIMTNVSSYAEYMDKMTNNLRDQIEKKQQWLDNNNNEYMEAKYPDLVECRVTTHRLTTEEQRFQNFINHIYGEKHIETVADMNN